MFDGRGGKGEGKIFHYQPTVIGTNKEEEEKGNMKPKPRQKKRGVFFGHVTCDKRERDLTRALALFRFQIWETRCPLLIGAVTAGYIIGLFLTNDGVIMTAMHNNNSSSTRRP